ncbi:pyridoxamine 5'-phosphate oxidase family protein [Aliisedimentitalea scapharcae]|uniref:Pyridoxamine 5'-phosphate oxidase family protein n=1 Tax=Aliisedimentitalea scapharcae TaxID=1524259 RepID=A0ABZ2XYS8_9RHOB|nr:pyridoxamine 5'-phosphate oxidase family protein [Rhodobacteraceae bacterium M382]
MPRAFAEIAFTPSVQAEQARMGSAAGYAKFLSPERNGGDALGPDEAQFIHMRDGFYQATVSETGWPYVQFRGGPRGFLRVLDARTIGYADLRGNRQYISLGNLTDNARVSLILMDYPNQARLKLWGTVRTVEAAQDPDLIARLMPDGQDMTAERAVLIDIAAFDWNCPRNIPQRLTLEELDPFLEPLRERISRLETENAALKASTSL